MSHDHNFQKIWEFRRKGDDDSSSDDSKTSCAVEPVLGSALILAGSDEISETTEFKQNEPVDRVDHDIRNGSTKNSRGTKNIKANKAKTTKKRAPTEGGTRKKRNGSTLGKVAVDDLKIFTKSILQDLKIERENMFEQMREEMRKLVDVKGLTKPPKVKKAKCTPKTSHQEPQQKRAKVDKKPRTCSDEPLERSVMSKRKTQNRSKVTEEQAKNDQATKTFKTKGKDKGEKLTLSARKSMYSSTQSDQVVSSPYLTLPSILPAKQVEHQRLESSTRNCIKSGIAGNGTSSTFQKEHLVFDEINHHAYFSGTQSDESFASLAQMGLKNMICYDQTPTIGTTTGFPIPVQQRWDNAAFNGPCQIVLPPYGGNNLLAMRMNGTAIRFLGSGRAAFCDNFVTNNLHGSMISNRPDVQLAGYGTLDIRDDHYYLT